jgi:hypothetical protein
LLGVGAEAQRRPFVNIGLRLPPDFAELIEAEAERVGLSRNDWLRAAAFRQLTSHRLTAKEAARFRRPETRRGQREYAESWNPASDGATR